jgi:ADP-heptose:LPS heptosyltransferase
MGRTDGFGAELLPQPRAFETALRSLDSCFRVQIGDAKQLYRLPHDLSLNGKTSISDIIDIGSICNGIVAQCSFCVPLAEAFNKPFLAVWAAAGMAPGVHKYLRAITPKKILSKPSSHHVVDTWSETDIRLAAMTFMRWPKQEAA